jgi:2-keto-3-deoxy-L-rhamnonate aldolase RhmA
MYKAQEIREKIKDGVVFGGNVVFGESAVCELYGRAGHDFVWIDLEHGAIDYKDALHHITATHAGGAAAIVRLPNNDPDIVKKILDMGADGIMIPRTETLEQLKTAIDGLHFAPIGRKGMGGHAQRRDGETFADFSKTRYLLPQIESPEGIKNLPKMLETYGEYISAVIVGPYDMSVMVGTPCDISSKEMTNAIQEVFDICKKYNKSCGIFCDDEVLAAKYRKMGANVLWMAIDRDYFMRGFNQMLDGVKSL